MCGILLIATGLEVVCGSEAQCCGPPAAAPCATDFAKGLACRGPDSQGSKVVTCGSAQIELHGSLLQLRGSAPCSTPLVDASGNVLLFNGQVFPPCRLAVPPGANDAQTLLQALGKPGADVADVLTGLRGPWALAFWHSTTRTLWFGRDPIGRRSLLLHMPTQDDGRFMLSSSAPLDPAVPFRGWAELPPGLYSLSLESLAVTPAAMAAPKASASAAAAAAAIEPAGAGGSTGAPAPPGMRPAACVPGSSQPGCVQPSSRVPARYTLHEWTDPAVRQLAAFHRPPELVPGPPAASQVAPVAGAAAAGAQAAATQEAEGQEDAQAAGAAGAAGAAAASMPADEGCLFEQTVDAVLAALRQAVATRCRCIDDWQHGRDQHRQQQQQQQQQHAAAPLLPAAPVLVLFSGGVDSTLLAALAHEALPPGVPIDLASICFDGGASPDRVSTLDALEELRQVAPGRQWRFVQVDCSLHDVDAARPRLLRLLAPRDTVMDLNIGAALWLAARGQGALLPPLGAEAYTAAAAGDAGEAQHCRGGQQPQAVASRGQAEPPSQPAQAKPQQAGRQPHAQACQGPSAQHPGPPAVASCRSVARVVLLGHGADELFGGYGRHRTSFRTRGWQGLAAELELDLRRLWLRNLGRDDRLVADHGREARHPFLDEQVVDAALAAPLHHLADLTQPPGVGDKRVLRACLRRLGLPRAAQRAKRAIQFGSRLAAKTNAAAFGSVRQANLRNAGSVRLADVPGAAGARDVAPTEQQKRDQL